MGRKLKGRQNVGKGLKGALQNHITNEKFKASKEKSLAQEKLRKENKDKSMKSGGKQKKQQLHGKETKAYIPFESSSTLLLVGEGDFSFAASIVRNGYIDPSKLIATSYDTQEQLQEKYPNVEEHLTFLRDEGVKIHHGVDATDLVSSLKLGTKKTQPKLFEPRQKLDYIMFNFPHTGRGMKDVDRNIRDHQKLVLGYFKSCKELLELVNNDISNDFGGYTESEKNSGSKIILSLFEGEPYISWGVKSLARSVGYCVERSGAFLWTAFEGYHHKRTNGLRDTTKPAAERDARIYLFNKFENRNVKEEKKRPDSDADDD
ncbi:putative 25S rRNA (Uracil2634-N3)-methyltransferase [Clavispora lusitaniae]|uniref:25S rRNA (Uracil2634-N3)-methyltransferase n=1 Tax=Clavispora lusitaniae TaxID=36911 RepID=A0AA91PYJ6_CLALS|nr:putative 25S rRNA (Uracil2634-N3)-methyltransferase [Clavispora lusitaniae]